MSIRHPRPVLELSDLSIRRGPVTILDRVNWRISKGQHWAILGANGSGKTSLLSALTGYLTPTTGNISVLGRTFGESDWRELRKRIGLAGTAIRQLMHDDETALHTVASGRHAMIAYWGPIRRSDQTAALAMLRKVECAHLEKRTWEVLSQGERQRILIGRALMAKPELLILDEPCAGLDPAAREHFLAFLQRLGTRRGGPAIILVTHHVEEITPCFSHILLLKKGKILAQGPREKVLTAGNLSKTFAARVRLDLRQGRHFLRIHSPTSHII